MKHIVFSLYLLLIFNDNSFCQTVYSDKSMGESISFKLKNNSLLPTKITVISYRPDETDNGTNGVFIIPFSCRNFSFPVGTKIYLANSEQVNTVMSGSKISDEAPFLLVEKKTKASHLI